ncbi:hypothetical protein F0562_012702 [Nyssa sinensis]|uniref:Cytochrome P450 n=1 Tax=Nyssa sinensis TaxID=561372 RepID=A0A5J4ZVW0_9ASTE|nr:hypothetical protein F0562_012702 [Nyssa sinensis]
MGKKPHITLANFAQSYGPLLSLRLGTQLLIVGSSPAAAEEILKTNDRILSARSVPHVAPAKSPELNHLSLGWAVECNDAWKSLRTICRTELFSGKAIESQACLREKKIMDLVKYLSSMEGKVVNVGEVVFATVFNVLSNALLSRDFIVLGVDGVMKGLELFSAGTDTSTSTVEWALAELIKNPESMKKVREELTREIKQESLKESHLPQLPYLQACVKETLRLHPPAPFLLPHRALDSCKVMNYTIPKNAQVVVNIWAIGRDPVIWEEPLKFKPERFLNSTLDFKGNDFEFLPFGAGRRICPGLPMGAKQVSLALASLIHHFDWSLPHGNDPNELDMNEKFGVTLHKEQPLLLIPEVKK